MKTIGKQLIIWSSALALSAGVAFAATYDFSSLNSSDGINNNKNPVRSELTPQQALLNSIVTIEAAEIDGSIEINSNSNNVLIDVDGNLAIENQEDISFSGNVNASGNAFNINAGIGYFDDTIFLDFNNNYFYLKTDSILEFVDMLPTYGVNITLPTELTSLNVSDLLTKIQNMEPVAISGGYLFTLSLTDTIDLFFKSDSNYNFTGARTNKFFFNDTFMYLDFDVNEVDIASIDISSPDCSLYQNFAPALKMFNVLYSTFNVRKNAFNITADINHLGDNYLDLNLDLNYDFENMKAAVKGDVIEELRTHSFQLGYQNEKIFVDYNNLHFAVSQIGVEGILNFLVNKIFDTYLNESLDSMTDLLANPSLENALNNISTINNLFSSVSISDGVMTIELNLAALELDASNIMLTVECSTDKFLGLAINGLTIGEYSADLKLTSAEYVEPSFSEDDYVLADPALSLVDGVLAMLDETRFRVEYSGTIVEETATATEMTLNGGLQFDVANKFGYGNIDLVDKTGYEHDLFVDMVSENEILLNYNKTMNGKFSSVFFTDLFDLVSQIYNEQDEHFVELFGDLLSMADTLPLMEAINSGDYGKLFEIGLIDSLDITTEEIRLVLSGGLLGLDTQIQFVINYDAYGDGINIIKGISIEDLKYGTSTINLSINLSQFDDSLENTRLDRYIDYIDFDDLLVLINFGVNTSKFNHYQLSGVANVQLSIGLSYSLSVPLDIKILNEKGNVKATISIGEIPVVIGVNTNSLYWSTSSRYATIHYADGYFYIERTEIGKTNLSILNPKYERYTIYSKADTSFFLENALYYICEVAMGMNSTIMSAINDSLASTGPTAENPIHYENILNDFIYKETAEIPYFYFDVDIYELSKNADLKSLTLKLYVDPLTSRFSGLDVHLGVVATIITINLDIKLDVINLGQTFTLDALENYVTAHLDDEINTTLISKTSI